MDLDPEIIKQLIETFTIELEEQSEVMIDGLLNLEKKDGKEEEYIKTIFRAAHNIKGAARGLGAREIGEISHNLESLFSTIQKKTITISANIISLCLEAVDALRLAMKAFVDKTPLTFDLDDLIHRLQGRESKKPIESVSVKKEVENPPESEEIVDAKNPVAQTENETIRVSLNKLDRVSALMEEIQVNKIAIDEHYSELTHLVTKTKQFSHLWKQTQSVVKNYLPKENKEGFQKLFITTGESLNEMTSITNQLYKNMRARINELTILSNSLQEEVRMLRLIPADTLFRTFPRVVRDLAHELNKKVDLAIQGGSVKMDKIVLQGLQNPIIHILRNAIDHGIEEADRREEKGKSSIGQIKIDISEEGNQILISISDDGGGIDLRRVARIAESKNIVSKADLETMTNHDILELIFFPGFSTKEIITDVSGRGVGLDVVKENMANLNGTVSITTEVDKGTTFYLRVPLTLASERGLLLRSAGQLFVLPSGGIERVMIMHPSGVIDVEASQAILLEGRPVPLLLLNHLLGIDHQDVGIRKSLPILVIKRGWQSIALLVDEIVGEREIVIKQLQAPLVNVPCVAGGTLSGKGQVIVVLNASDLINKALFAGKGTRLVLQDETEKTVVRPHILVVDDSITTRTLEKNVLESKNYQVTVAVNGKEAWDILQKQPFALLITDVNMPIMDGFTLTEHVKQSEKLRDMPVIIVTSLGSDAEKKRGVDVGANAYVVKNEFESGALLEIVKQLV